MTKTTAPKKTPSPATAVKLQNDGGTTRTSSSVFFAAVMDMSWRLAIVVLVPIIGGYELDQNLGTEPWLTVLGFVVALGGIVIVLWQMLKEVSQMPVPTKGKHS